MKTYDAYLHKETKVAEPIKGSKKRFRYCEIAFCQNQAVIKLDCYLCSIHWQEKNNSGGG